MEGCVQIGKAYVLRWSLDDETGALSVVTVPTAPSATVLVTSIDEGGEATYVQATADTDVAAEACAALIEAGVLPKSYQDDAAAVADQQAVEAKTALLEVLTDQVAGLKADLGLDEAATVKG